MTQKYIHKKKLLLGKTLKKVVLLLVTYDDIGDHVSCQVRNIEGKGLLSEYERLDSVRNEDCIHSI